MDKKEFFEVAQLVAFRRGGRLWQQLASLLENRLNVVFDGGDPKDMSLLMFRTMSIPDISLFVLSLANEETKISFHLFDVDDLEKKVAVVSVALIEWLSPLQQAIMVAEVEAMGFSRQKAGEQNIIVFHYDDGPGPDDVSVGAIVFDDDSIEVFI